MSGKNEINIVCAANALYAMPLAVTLVSLFRNLARGRFVNIYIIDAGLSGEERAKILQVVPRATANVYWCEPEWAKLGALDFEGHAGRETYLRLLAPYILPRDCDRAIFLDCDLVIVSDLSCLWDFASGDKVLYACQDINIPFVSSEGGVFNYSEMAIPSNEHYFNAGVLAMNLKRWRDEEVTPHTLDYLRLYRGKARFHEQGGLNAILYGRWGEIDPRWNQTHGILSQGQWLRAGRKGEEYRRARYKPYIIHFSGSVKPWHPECRDPRKSAFFKYLAMTPYRGCGPVRPWLEKMLGSEWYYAIREMKHRLRRPRDNTTLSTPPERIR